MLGRLVIMGDEPRISSEHELVHLIEKGDFLDDETKNLVQSSLSFRDQTVTKVSQPRDRIAFIHAKDSLTPKFLDELFSSGHHIFPVVQGSLDHTVGLLYLDDVLPIEQDEKDLLHIMRKMPPPIEHDAPLKAALQQMAEYHTGILMVTKKEKVVGMVVLGDIVRALFNLPK